jgi:hypothetical protein
MVESKFAEGFHSVGRIAAVKRSGHNNSFALVGMQAENLKSHEQHYFFRLPAVRRA